MTLSPSFLMAAFPASTGKETLTRNRMGLSSSLDLVDKTARTLLPLSPHVKPFTIFRDAVVRVLNPFNASAKTGAHLGLLANFYWGHLTKRKFMYAKARRSRFWVFGGVGTHL